jgi:hypothetical protein
VIARQGARLDLSLISSELAPLLEAKGAVPNFDRLRGIIGEIPPNLRQ